MTSLSPTSNCPDEDDFDVENPSPIPLTQKSKSRKSKKNNNNNNNNNKNQKKSKPKNTFIEKCRKVSWEKIRNKKVSYERFFWVLFTITTVLWVVDRFTTNYWPRQSFGKDMLGVGFDKIPLKDGPAGVKMYDILARISGRASICTMNALFVTMMHTSYNYISDKNIPFIDMHGWQEVNSRIHTIMGWGTAVMMVPHVWSVFFPVIFNGWRTVYFAPPSKTILLFPISEWKFNCPTVNNDDQSICFNTDNLGRLIGMTFIFCILFPLSRMKKLLSYNFVACKWLHIICAAAYAIDIIRRRSHPHSWVLNMPVVVMYITDRLAAWYLYRSEPCEIVQRLVLDNSYYVLFWKSRSKRQADSRIGDVYWLRAADTSIVERYHPFTCIHNHGFGMPEAESSKRAWGGHRFSFCGSIKDPSGKKLTEVLDSPIYEDDTKSLSPFRESSSTGWSNCAIIKFHDDERRGCCGTSQTTAMIENETQVIDVLGPYRSSYSVLSNEKRLPKHVTLIASGSGGSLLVDFALTLLKWESESKTNTTDCDDPDMEPYGASPEERVQMVYTSRSIGLFQYVTDRLYKAPECVTIRSAITMPGLYYNDESTDFKSPEATRALRRRSSRTLQTRRLDIEEILEQSPSHTEVFFCGSPELSLIVSDACRKHKLKLHDSHEFAS